MTDESLDEVYPDAVNVTDRVKCYKTGKVFYCDCEQGFGVPYGEQMWKCPTCKELIIDTEAGDREPPSDNNKEPDDSNEKDQSNLESFF